MSDEQTTPAADESAAAAPKIDIRVEKGNPSDAEVAALVAVLSSAAGGGAAEGPADRDMWGHPVDRLRYPLFSWQRVTLLERTHMRR